MEQVKVDLTSIELVFAQNSQSKADPTINFAANYFTKTKSSMPSLLEKNKTALLACLECDRHPFHPYPPPQQIDREDLWAQLTVAAYSPMVGDHTSL